MSQSPHDSAELPDSRLYTLLDRSREYALYFLEGQKLVHDLALLHPVSGGGFAYFRDTLLSVQPMIALLKQGEQFGFYIDSDEPAFRLKIEASQHGAMRCTLLPEGFAQFPESVTGIVRLQKLFPNNRPPYSSVLEAVGLPLREIVNRVLAASYQVQARISVSSATDQSVLLLQLPPLGREPGFEHAPDALQSRWQQMADPVHEIMRRALVSREEIEAAFDGLGFDLLAERINRFECSCSRERVLQGLSLLSQADRADLFLPGQTSIEVKCEYCKAVHQVSRDDVDGAVSPLN